MSEIETLLTVNGREVALRVAPDRLLIAALRDDLGLTGTKLGCGTGDCGTCTVLLDGAAVNACLLYAVQCQGRSVETIEHVAATPRGARLVAALLAEDAVQCGICTPGFVVAAVAAADRLGATPTALQVRRELAGNLCRCTGYRAIIAAVQAAAADDRDGDEGGSWPVDGR